MGWVGSLPGLSWSQTPGALSDVLARLASDLNFDLYCVLKPGTVTCVCSAVLFGCPRCAPCLGSDDVAADQSSSLSPSCYGLESLQRAALEGWTQACGAEVPRQLRIDAAGKAVLRRDTSLPQLQTSRRMRWLQANALVQHGVPVKELVRQADPSVIYSPFTDFLFSVRDCPQVITCHDLIPLHYPSSHRAYWRSRLWLPRHLQAATKIVAISQAVADLLVADGLSPQRIAVIPNGIECVDDPIDQPISQDVMLLARHGVNKNVALALKGFARLLALEPVGLGV